MVATEEETAANAKRLAYEDSLRNAYTATFPTKDNFKQLMKPNPNLTDEQAWEIICKSEGNYAIIIGGLWCPNCHSTLRAVYDEAVKFNIGKIYYFEPEVFRSLVGKYGFRTVGETEGVSSRLLVMEKEL